MIRSSDLLIKFSGLALILLGIIHIAVMTLDVLPLTTGWLQGDLWTTRHLLPFGAQPPNLLASNAAFWATLGSCAVPLILLGALITRLQTLGLRVPPFIGWTLCLWFGVCALIMEPSGFAIAWIVSLFLLLGTRRDPHLADGYQIGGDQPPQWPASSCRHCRIRHSHEQSRRGPTSSQDVEQGDAVLPSRKPTMRIAPGLVASRAPSGKESEQ